MTDYDTYLQDQIDDTLGSEYLTIENYCKDLIKITGLTIKDQKILDLGCREFHSYQFFKEAFHLEITGIDVGKDGHEYAHKLGRPSIYCDAHDMSMFEDESFDVVMATHVFEHMFDLTKVIGECKRILKPGGFLYVAVPFPCENLHKGHWQEIKDMETFKENFKEWEIINEQLSLPGDERNIKGQGEIFICAKKI